MAPIRQLNRNDPAQLSDPDAWCPKLQDHTASLGRVLISERCFSVGPRCQLWPSTGQESVDQGTSPGALIVKINGLSCLILSFAASVIFPGASLSAPVVDDGPLREAAPEWVPEVPAEANADHHKGEQRNSGSGGSAFQEPGNKSQTFVHNGAFLPRHQHLPPKCEKCYPCLRYDLSPMSQVGHLMKTTFQGRK